MKPIAEQSDKKAAFTIIELLTVMSVIIILIGLLVPGLNALRRYARKVATKNQFHAIDVGLETFNAEWGDYPVSTAMPGDCGATRLTEAMVGTDLMGYDPGGTYLDPNSPARRMYLPVERANAYKLGDLYYDPVTMISNTGPLNADSFVLCDEYRKVEHKTGALVGMPLLYYRANAPSPGPIYNYADNAALIDLGKPWDGNPHQLTQPLFGQMIRNNEIWDTFGIYRPKRADSYILLSAGHDGEYGTDDDIFNF